jgi:hypothetical protein
MHGGAIGSGGPRGQRNGNYRHGLWIRKQLEERRKLLAQIRELKLFFEQRPDLSELARGCCSEFEFCGHLCRTSQSEMELNYETSRRARVMGS